MAVRPWRRVPRTTISSSISAASCCAIALQGESAATTKMLVVRANQAIGESLLIATPPHPSQSSLLVITFIMQHTLQKLSVLSIGRIKHSYQLLLSKRASRGTNVMNHPHPRRETIRLWCIKFGPLYARRLKGKHRGYGDTSFIDEVFVKINGKQHYLWRAVDQDGEVVGVYLQAKRDGAAAKRFFRRLLRSHGSEPRKIVTDKLRSYGVAHRELIPETIHENERYANNRAEQSHEATRVRERGMRRFKSPGQAQRFLGAHAAVSNLFNLGRHLIRAEYYRNFRMSAFTEWSGAVA